MWVSFEWNVRQVCVVMCELWMSCRYFNGVVCECVMWVTDWLRVSGLVVGCGSELCIRCGQGVSDRTVYMTVSVSVVGE